MQGKSYSAEQMEAEYIRGNIKKMDKFRFSTRKAYIILSEYYFPFFNIQAMCMFIKDINSGWIHMLMCIYAFVRIYKHVCVYTH